jgi:hypothetical protein
LGFLKKFTSHLTAPDGDANLQLSEQYVVVGDNLEGTLTIAPHETIDCDEVRCELNCTETAQVIRNFYDPNIKRMVPRQVTETQTLYQANALCCPATQLVNGVSRTFKVSATFQWVHAPRSHQ